MAHHAEGTQRIEMKFPQRSSLDLRADIPRQELRLTQSELRSRRARFTRLCVNNGGAVTQGPESSFPRQSQTPINDQSPAFVFFKRQGLHKRVGCCACG